MSNCLIVTDVQYQFLNKQNEKIPGLIYKLAMIHKFDYIVATKFIKADNTLVNECLGINKPFNKNSTNIHPYIETFICKAFEHNTFDCITDEFLCFIRANNIDKFYFVGLNTDTCILSTVITLCNLNLKTIIISDYCRSTKFSLHLETLNILNHLIGKDNVLDNLEDEMKKLIVVINGKGSTGKDTFCDIVNTMYPCMNVSSVDPIKQIASEHGWDGSKSANNRLFLHYLKKAFVAFNDLPTKYLNDMYDVFTVSDKKIMFVHIREAEEIDKFKKNLEIPCVTLLIRRDTGIDSWGNDSDDNVENYNYDYHYNYTDTIEESIDDIKKYMKEIFEKHAIDA